MNNIHTNASIFDMAPLLGMGRNSILPKYLSYTSTQCFWSEQPPILLSNGKLHYPKGTYRQAFERNGKPALLATPNTVKILIRENV